MKQILKKHTTVSTLFGLGILLLISIVPLFVNLGEAPIQLWDESRVATNSFELYKSGKWLIPTFEGVPELWNTKPPMLLWFQKISMGVFGVNEFAIRLPSALAGLGTFILIFLWLRRIGCDITTSLMPTILLIISPGFTGWHCLRTGDYEALLIFFLMVQLVAFYLYLRSDSRPQQRKWLILFLVALVFATWTKGVSAFLFTPALAAFWIVNRMWKRENILRFVLKISITFILAVSYYIIRESLEPGYFSWVSRNELGGRFLETYQGMNNDPNLYFQLFPKQTGTWFKLFIPLTLVGVTFGTKNERELLVYIITNGLLFFLAIYSSKSQTIWYNLPLLPLIAICFSVGLRVLFDFLKKYVSQMHKVWILPAFISVVFFFPLFRATKHTLLKDSSDYFNDPVYQVTCYLRAHEQDSEFINVKFLDKNYSAHNWWYIQQMNHTRNANVTYGNNIQEISAGDTVLLYQKELQVQLSLDYRLDVMDTFGDTRLLRILE